VHPTYVLAVYGADEEDHELEDAEHEAVLRGGGSFPLRLQTQVTSVSAWRHVCAPLRVLCRSSLCILRYAGDCLPDYTGRRSGTNISPIMEVLASIHSLDTGHVY
jgi:hypothetical protein